MILIPEISVIVPMYNVEKFIKRCIDSILAQSFTDFELILIDDGSPDNCYEICKDYADRDERVKLFRKSNGGLSDARNYGLGLAKGKYITFIDSDDYITHDYLKTLYDLITVNNADVAVGNYQEVNGNSFPDVEQAESEITVDIYNSKDALYQLLATSRYLQMDTAWAKLIDADIAKKHLFPVGQFHEDEATTYLYYIDATKIAVTNKVIYAYYQNADGIMHNIKNDKKTQDALSALVNRATNLEKLGWNYEADRAWLFVYGWLSELVIDYPEKRWEWKETYTKLIGAKALTRDIKSKAFFFMHFPKLFAAIQKKRGKA